MRYLTRWLWRLHCQFKATRAAGITLWCLCQVRAAILFRVLLYLRRCILTRMCSWRSFKASWRSLDWFICQLQSLAHCRLYCVAAAFKVRFNFSSESPVALAEHDSVALYFSEVSDNLFDLLPVNHRLFGCVTWELAWNICEISSSRRDEISDYSDGCSHWVALRI